MDKRKPIGRTAQELKPIFDRLPRASLCLDLGHVRQIDPTLIVARQILREYGARLRLIHLSEVDAQCKHAPLSTLSVLSLRHIAADIPPVPVILESRVHAHQMADELRMARMVMEPEQHLARAV